MQTPVAEDFRITFQEELRFMLYRHWNLYDAMYYSPYLASRLGIWRTQGQRRLRTFLAKMGISLRQAKQKCV